jgi:NADH:ubiquinone oxidoreductase subunit E
LKSDRVIVHGSQEQSTTLVSQSAATSSTKPTKQKGKILLCRKSSCSKRGGKQFYSTLKETLAQLGLQDQVKIQLTGCQKQCKKAPSIILMPGKAKYTQVHPQKLASVLKTHYLTEPREEEVGAEYIQPV